VNKRQVFQRRYRQAQTQQSGATAGRQERQNGAHITAGGGAGRQAGRGSW